MLTNNQTKKLALSVLALPLLAVLLLASAASPSRAQGEGVEATYKTKCSMCHGVKADKSFDSTKPDAALADAVLKGIKPKMPSYDQKLGSDQVKALVGYMKSLRN
jgi:mono/diheme cytochrome c family protein